MARLRKPALAALLVAAALAPAAGADRPPASFGVPALAPGDAWTYAVSDGNGSALASPESPYDGGVLEGVAYRFLGGGGTLDAAGFPRSTRVLEERASHRSAGGGDRIVVLHTHHTDAGAPVARTWSGIVGGGGASFNLILPDGTPVGQSEEEVQYADRTAYDGVPPACGHESQLQGGAVPLGKPFRAWGACPAGGWFRAEGMPQADGRGAVVAVSEEDPAVQLWFRADLPVPVRIQQRPPWNANLLEVLDLVAFEAGDAPPPAAPAPAPAAPIAFARREAWGPSEAGVAHPFPLSEAHRAALGEEGTARYLAGHPGAYVQAASHHELRRDGGPLRDVERTWQLRFSDGKSAHAVDVTRTWRAALLAGNEAFLPVAPQESFHPAGAGEGPWPAPESLPATMPTVASLLARWEAYRASPGPANAWGFELGCADTACGAARTLAWGGRDHRAWPMAEVVVLAGVMTDRREASLTTVDDAGATVEHLETHVVEASRVRVGGLEIGDPPAVAAAPQAAAAPPAWPWVAGASAIGLMALLGAAAWAAAKGGGTALWHRDLPAPHPVRRALLDLVAAHPGIHHQELMRRLGKGNSVVTHHLRALRRSGEVAAVKGPRYVCYFPQGALDHRLMGMAPILKSPLARRILAELGRAPASNRELAGRLGVGASSIHWHLRRIQAAGLVAAERDGRSLRLRLTDLGAASVAQAAAGT